VAISGPTELIDLVYDAVLDPGLWPRFLRALAGAIGGASIGMSLRHPRPGNPGWIVFHDTDPAYDVAYQERFFGIDPFRLRSGTLSAGSCEVMAGGAIDARALERSEFYNEWMRPQGWLPSPSLGVTLDRDQYGEPIGLGIFRPRGARAYGDRELRLLRTLVPHLQRATRTALRLSQAETEATVGAGAIELLPVAALLIDPDGRVMRANRKALALAERGDAVAHTRSGLVLRPHLSALRRRFAEAQCSGRIVDAPAEVAHHSSIPRAGGGAPLRVSIIPCSAVRASGTDGPPGYAWLLIEDPDEIVRPSVAALESQLGLTTAEARLCALLVSGQRLDEAAEELGVSQETVRSQLKSTFRKTGARSQADLVRLVLQRPMLARGDRVRST
jgi:DNA-binding CsgD family transcriptional regulator/PAS domain-containing protein